MADYVITPASVLASSLALRIRMPYISGAQFPSCIAGETIEAGEWVYQSANNGDRFHLADATFLTAATSGSLVVGRVYVITTFVAGDNFTNVGAGSNATGIIFVASGTTPTTWSNGSTLNDADQVDEVAGVAENKAFVGQPVSVVYEDPNFAHGGAAVLAGDSIILSSNRGKICEAGGKSAGFFVSGVGTAKSATHMAVMIVRADAVKV